MGVEDPADLVGLVAIHTGGYHVRFLFPELAPNHFLMHILDPGMALGAGPGDVGRGDGRALVGVREHEVRCVAACANGNHREPTLEKALAVDTLGVVVEDVLLGDIMREADWRALVVALAAKPRDFHGRDR